jgi:DNA-binding MarR family transcriptional regulator
VKVTVDKEDRRSRRLALTDAGRKLLIAAMPIWEATHKALEKKLPQGDAQRLRAALNALAQD